MKRIYEVTIGSDAETATNSYRVLRPNVIEAARAALRVYHKNGSDLFGHARVMHVKEVGEIEG